MKGRKGREERERERRALTPHDLSSVAGYKAPEFLCKYTSALSPATRLGRGRYIRDVIHGAVALLRVNDKLVYRLCTIRWNRDAKVHTELRAIRRDLALPVVDRALGLELLRRLAV